MPAEEREYSARDLTSRWLTVEEVLGRRAVRAVTESAGEYPAAPAGAAGPESAAADPADADPVAGLSAADLSAPDLSAPDVSAVGPQLPAPDLVAADTDLASRWFTADPTPGKLAGRTVVLPFVAVAELATWPERLLWSHPRGEDLSLWTDPRRMILGDDTVCRIWARINVAAQRAGSPPPAHDSWIAAGCLSYGLPLATLNKRRYRYFSERYGLQLL